MNNWANYIRGNYAGPVIQVNNATELHALQDLAERCRLEGYNHFKTWKYRDTLYLLEINYKRLHDSNEYQESFYKATNGGKSFLVEYSYKGFCPATLIDYDKSREDPEDWEIIQMEDIMKEFNMEEDK